MPAYFCDRCGAPTNGASLCDACQQTTQLLVNQRTKDRICWAALCAGVVFIVVAAVFSAHYHAVGFAVAFGGAVVSLIIGVIMDR